MIFNSNFVIESYNEQRCVELCEQRRIVILSIVTKRTRSQAVPRIADCTASQQLSGHVT